jgi:hypothetical protein
VQLDEAYARELIEQIAGYPGVSGRRMESDSKTTVGVRATEILLRLARMRSGFVS